MSQPNARPSAPGKFSGVPCAFARCRSYAFPEIGVCDYHTQRVIKTRTADLEERVRLAHLDALDWLVKEAQYRSDLKRLEAEVLRLHQKVASKKTEKTPAREGTIYYLRSDGIIKIGFTTRWPLRMREYPPGATLLATHPGTRDDETKLKRKFAVHRTHGSEWLAPVAPVMEHVDRVIAEFGTPAPVQFAAKRAATRRPAQKAYVGGNNRGRWKVGEISTGKTA